MSRKYYLLLAATMLLSLSLESNAAPQSKAAAKKPASPKPAGTPQSNSALNNYATALRQKMGANWNFPNGVNNVNMTIKVNQDGSVSDLQLSSNPKNTEAEQKANDAFNSAQPLQPLPAGTSAATIKAVFDSKTDSNGQDCKAGISIRIDPDKTAAPAETGNSGANTDEKK